ncbi:MAG: hypothetical protein JXA24_00695 [Proteobacteria bacterium]|nr:hypothetical protein [Pseudomonadota bacterium]
MQILGGEGIHVVKRFSHEGRQFIIHTDRVLCATGEELVGSERSGTNRAGPEFKGAMHEPIAQRTFDAAFKSGVRVGQLRTRLGIPGCETTGPEEAASALLDIMKGR